jgi:hypothetical protein
MDKISRIDAKMHAELVKFIIPPINQTSRERRGTNQ